VWKAIDGKLAGMLSPKDLPVFTNALVSLLHLWQQEMQV
jgi:hypothetical protein